MAERLLPEQIDFDGAFPRLSRKLRLGVVGGGTVHGVTYSPMECFGLGTVPNVREG